MEREAVSRLYELHKNGIFRYALSITRDVGFAEDILHDTFLKLMTKGGALPAEKAQAWLYKVARNLCIDHLRKSKREQPSADAPAGEATGFGYLDLIAPLSEGEREIVTLKIVGGLTHREIGAVLGITPKAAQKRYERAIGLLREQED